MRGVEFIGPGYICSDGYEPPLFSTLNSTHTGATFFINQLWYKILYENTELVKSIEIYTQLALCTAD
jgi:hypothetical protein